MASAFLLSVSSLIAAADSPRNASPTVGLVDRVLSLLARGGSRDLAAILHYPESYTADERAKDVSNVATSLDFLLDRFGKPEKLRPVHESASFYEMGVGGGSVHYWASLSLIAEQTLLYSGSFSKLGPGFIKLSVVRVKGGPPEIRVISFGLPTSSPSAKATITNLSVSLMEQMGVPMSPEVRKSISEHLQPITTPPASLE